REDRAHAQPPHLGRERTGTVVGSNVSGGLYIIFLTATNVVRDQAELSITPHYLCLRENFHPLSGSNAVTARKGWQPQNTWWMSYVMRCHRKEVHHGSGTQSSSRHSAAEPCAADQEQPSAEGMAHADAVAVRGN